MKCEVLKLYVGPGGAILGGDFPEWLLEKAIEWVEDQNNEKTPIIAKNGIIVPAKWVGNSLEAVRNPIIKCSAYRGFLNKTYLVRETVVNAGEFVIISNGKYRTYLFDNFAVESANKNEIETVEKIKAIREQLEIRRGVGVLSRNNFVMVKIEGNEAYVYKGKVSRQNKYAIEYEEDGPLPVVEALRKVPWYM